MLQKLKKYFSGERVGLLILMAGIAGRIIQVVYFYNVRVDRCYQLLAMQNLVDGHGVTLARVVPGQLSGIIYEPLIKWPPGYSLLVAPFYLLFHKNYIWSTLSIDILFAVLLIVICRKILRALDTPDFLVNLFPLIAGFFLYDFYVITSSDAIAITFFLLAIYLALLVLKRRGSWLTTTFFLTLCLFTCGVFKYLYIPAIFTVPVFLFVYSLFNDHPACKKSAVVVFSLLVVGIGVLLFYQKYVSGSATYISQPQRGIFIENLSKFYPFLPASFIKPSTIESLRVFGVDSINIWFQIIHLACLIPVVIMVVHASFKSRLRNLTFPAVLFYLSFVLSFCIVLLLFYLSLTVEKEDNSGSLWTYVQEPRYYGLVIVLIQLCVFANYRFWKEKSARPTVLLFLFLLFFAEAVHGVYFDYQRVRLVSKEQYSWQYEKRFQEYADSIIQKAKKGYQTEKLAVTGTSFYFNMRVSLFSHVPVMEEVQTINNLASLKTKEPILVLIILAEKEAASYSSFLSAAGKQAVGNMYGFTFYTVYVKPD